MNALVALIACAPCLLVVRHLSTRLGGGRASRALWGGFGAGALSTVLVFAVAPLVAVALAAPLPLPLRGLVDAFGRAAFPEEAAKLLALVAFSVDRGHVRDRRSGIAHGLAVAAGFASVEMVLATGVGGAGAALLRTLTAVPCHLLVGILMGRLVGDAIADPFAGWQKLVLAFCLPALVHGAYDYPLMVLKGAARTGVRIGTTELVLLAALGAAVLVGGVVAARRVYQASFPHVPGFGLRSRIVRVADRMLATGAVAWALVPIGGLLASTGGWLVGSLLLFPVRGPEAPANAAVAVTALYAVGAALICFGLAFAVRGLRAHRAAIRARAGLAASAWRRSES